MTRARARAIAHAGRATRVGGLRRAVVVGIGARERGTTRSVDAGRASLARSITRRVAADAVGAVSGSAGRRRRARGSERIARSAIDRPDVGTAVHRTAVHRTDVRSRVALRRHVLAHRRVQPTVHGLGPGQRRSIQRTGRKRGEREARHQDKAPDHPAILPQPRLLVGESGGPIPYGPAVAGRHGRTPPTTLRRRPGRGQRERWSRSRSRSATRVPRAERSAAARAAPRHER